MITAKRFIIFLSATLFLFLSACSSPEKDKEALYQKALKYIEENQKDAAILELRSAIQLDAKFSDARYQLGLLYLEKGEPQQAFSEFVRVSDIDPDNLDASLKTAQFYLLARKKEESRKKINHILEKEPNHKDTLALLANLELIEGNFTASSAALDQIGEDVETSDQLQNIRGRIHAAKGEWSAAEAAFKKAISASEENIANYQILLRAYEQQNKTEESKVLLDEMVEKFPDNPQPHLLLAGYYRLTGKLELIGPELEKVIAITPENPLTRIQLAQHLRGMGKVADAEALLIKAREDIKDSIDLSASLAALYFDQGKYEQAAALLEEMKAIDEGHSGTKLLSARFLLREGKVRDGIVKLQELNTDYPNWPDPYFYLGLAHFSLREIDLAEAAITKAIQKNKNVSKYHAFMAQIHQTRGQFEDAKKEAAIALKLNPKNLRSAIILSRALIGEKKFEKAVEILKSMVEQVPTNLEVLESLALAALGSKDLALGEETLNKILEIDPGHNRAIALYLGLKYNNDLSGAETFIIKQLDSAPEDIRLLLVLGDLQAKQKKYDAALDTFSKAKEVSPNSPRPYLASAKVLTVAGRKDEALSKYISMLEKYPTSIAGRMGIASIYEMQGDSAKAMEHYEKALEAKEDFAPAANNLAWLIASDPKGDLGKALQLAMVAKQAHPEDPNIADTLGWVHYHRKSYSLAIAQFQQALEQVPSNPVINYHLALAQAGSQNKDAAIRILQNLLNQNMKFRERPQAEALLSQLTEK